MRGIPDGQALTHGGTVGESLPVSGAERHRRQLLGESRGLLPSTGMDEDLGKEHGGRDTPAAVDSVSGQSLGDVETHPAGSPRRRQQALWILGLPVLQPPQGGAHQIDRSRLRPGFRPLGQVQPIPAKPDEGHRLPEDLPIERVCCDDLRTGCTGIERR